MTDLPVIDLNDSPDYARRPQPHYEDEDRAVMAAIDLDDEKVTENDDGSKTLKLTYSLTKTIGKGERARTETVSELRFRRPNGGDLIDLESKPETQKSRLMFCRLSGISQTEFAALDLEDITAGMDAIADFLPKSRATGRIA